MKVFLYILLLTGLFGCGPKSRSGSGKTIVCPYDTITNKPNGLFLLVLNDSSSVGMRDGTTGNYYSVDSLNQISFSEIDTAYVEYVSTVKRNSIVINLSQTGRQNFEHITKTYVMRSLGLVLDGELIVAAQILSPIASSQVSLMFAESEDRVTCITRSILQRAQKGKKRI
ncbi:MAG: hypothetical protein JNM68_07885 [Dinghuibacter sp.]|nr:hypothetical protein [Dinghuibacter sp.]